VNIGECYKQAWRGFSRWWIPLCAIALIAVVADALPRMLAQNDVTQTSLMKDVWSMTQAMAANDLDAVQQYSRRVRSGGIQFIQALGRYTLYSLPVVLPVAVLLIVFGMKASSKEGLDIKKDARTAGRRGFYVLLTQIYAMVVTAIPILLFALFARFLQTAVKGQSPAFALGLVLVALLGLFVALFFTCICYILFFFAPQLAADEELGPIKSMIVSQRMVRRSFMMVFLLVMTNVTIQGFAAITVIGLIPATAFVNTARGAAYYQLLELERADGNPAEECSTEKSPDDDQAQSPTDFPPPVTQA
jgi:hypothetical protein